jgi:uncharacterized delta-60 repeat protein
MRTRARLPLITLLWSTCALLPAGTAFAASAGSPDPSFGGNPAPGFSAANLGFDAEHAALDDWGHYILGGNYSPSGGGSNFAVVRVGEEGQFDQTFGPALNGLVSVPIANGAAYAAADDSTSEDAVVGGTGAPSSGPAHDFALAGFVDDPVEVGDGTVDATFGGQSGAAKGTELTSFAQGPAGIEALTTDSAGNIVAAGYVITGSNSGGPVYSLALARYTDHGQLDTSFGGKSGAAPGTTVTSLANSAFPLAVAIEPGSGKILVAGLECDVNCETYPQTNKLLVARYNVNGELDTSFGPGGHGTNTIELKSSSTKEPVDTAATGLVVEGSGNIVLVSDAAVSGPNELVLTQLNSSGVLSNFESTNSPFSGAPLAGGEAYSSGIVLQGDGKLLATGTYQPSNGEPGRLALVRFNPDGSYDKSFGNGGATVTPFRPSTSSGEVSAEASAINPVLKEEEGTGDIVLPAKLFEKTSSEMTSEYVGLAGFTVTGAVVHEVCPAGYTGIYPNCVAPSPPPDTTPPVIDLSGSTINVSGSIVALNEVRTLHFKCLDDDPASCTAEISMAGVTPSSYESGKELSAWQPGEWHVHIEATDRAGNRSHADIYYLVQTQAEAYCNTNYQYYNVISCINGEKTAPQSALSDWSAGVAGVLEGRCHQPVGGCITGPQGNTLAEYEGGEKGGRIIAVGSGSVIAVGSGTAGIIAVGSGSLQVQGGRIIAVGSGSFIAAEGAGVIAVGSGTAGVIAVGSGSFGLNLENGAQGTGLLGTNAGAGILTDNGQGLIAMNYSGFGLGSMDMAGLISDKSVGFSAAAAAVLARHDKHRKHSTQPKMAKLISGAAIVTKRGGSATMVLDYTAKGKKVIGKLEQLNAKLRKRHKKLHSLKITLRLTFTPKTGKATTVSKTITLTPVVPQRPAKRHKHKTRKHSKHHK